MRAELESAVEEEEAESEAAEDAAEAESGELDEVSAS